MGFDAFVGPARGLDGNLSETFNYSNEFERFDDGWIDRPIFTRFRLIAARNPGKIALDDGVLQLTYQDVLRVAQNLALHVEATVAKGRPIGIFQRLASTLAQCQRCKAAFPVRILSSAKSQQSTTVCVHANR